MPAYMKPEIKKHCGFKQARCTLHKFEYLKLGVVHKLREQDFGLFSHPLPPCEPVY